MLQLTSPTISDGGTIPRRHLGPGHGDDLSPELTWSSAPQGTACWALTLTDDDAPGYQHWLMLLPGEATHLDDGTVPPGASVGQGTRAAGYEGPCPPSGTHHYRFTITALDQRPALDLGFTADQLAAATAGHQLATATLAATYTPGLRHELDAQKSRLLGAVRRVRNR